MEAEGRAMDEIAGGRLRPRAATAILAPRSVRIFAARMA
jgi:hypothetical protein